MHTYIQSYIYIDTQTQKINLKKKQIATTATTTTTTNE